MKYLIPLALPICGCSTYNFLKRRNFAKLPVGEVVEFRDDDSGAVISCKRVR